MDKDLLRNIPLFARLSDADRAELASLMTRRDVKALEPVFWIGEDGDAMYVVAHGQIRLSYPDEEGHDVTVAVLGPARSSASCRSSTAARAPRRRGR